MFTAMFMKQSNYVPEQKKKNNAQTFFGKGYNGGSIKYYLYHKKYSLFYTMIFRVTVINSLTKDMSSL